MVLLRLLVEGASSTGGGTGGFPSALGELLLLLLLLLADADVAEASPVEPAIEEEEEEEEETEVEADKAMDGISGISVGVSSAPHKSFNTTATCVNRISPAATAVANT